MLHLARGGKVQRHLCGGLPSSLKRLPTGVSGGLRAFSWQGLDFSETGCGCTDHRGGDLSALPW